MRQSTLDGFESIDYTDPEWLREKYHEEDMSMVEMAELAGVANGTISRHMKKNGIDTRSPSESRTLRGTYESDEEKIHFDEEWLQTKYYDEYWSVGDMAEEADVPPTSITYQMDKYGMDRRPGYVTHVMKNPGAGFVHANVDGYEIVKHSVDDHTYSYFVHRLVAVAKWGYDEVDGKLVHHKSGIPWDNRHDNLQLMDGNADHQRLHSEQRDVPPSEWHGD